jgi:hypothetical protein
MYERARNVSDWRWQMGLDTSASPIAMILDWLTGCANMVNEALIVARNGAFCAVISILLP